MCPNPESGQSNEWDMSEPMWKRILDSDDPKLIWKSINWKGGITQENEKKPEDDQFKYHFETLLNPNECREEQIDTIGNDVGVNIPILDDPFTPDEMMQAIHGMHKNKSYSGLCPGLVSQLSESWLMFILSVFNIVFLRVCYGVIVN
ncbi:hypothetical protein Pmani_007075 [Petrolisthes manimaculis]|uniref:Uncharacterized protein n=1 Tax=Petrolisthes manimaculis TaxID=1843537 RepID=A0AAE1Q887_9EUCA|nr:hypothetical protein Pmani_007075 [Petrolisthes manimaculis]